MSCIIHFEKRTLSAARLIGHKYTDDDRVDDTFKELWHKCFQDGTFDRLRELSVIDSAYYGYMRMDKNELEYWIGMLCTPETAPPDGFESVDIQARNIADTWVKGKEPEIYADAHKLASEAVNERRLSCVDDGWFGERYDQARFVNRDENGESILDYHITVK